MMKGNIAIPSAKSPKRRDLSEAGAAARHADDRDLPPDRWNQRLVASTVKALQHWRAGTCTCPRHRNSIILKVASNNTPCTSFESMATFPRGEESAMIKRRSLGFSAGVALAIAGLPALAAGEKS
jgi:hypothetical protein